MPTFSLKTLLVAVSIGCFTCLALTNPSMAMAKALMLIVAISMLALTVVGFWLRRPLAFALVFLSIGYLVIADGGIFPSAERYLPTEWGLERYCDCDFTELYKPNRPNSLTKWALAVDQNHNDWQYVNPAKPTTIPDREILAHPQPDTDDVLDALLDIVDSNTEAQTYTPGVSIQLPVFVVTGISTVVTIGPRSYAQNRPHFIVGHCLIVTLAPGSCNCFLHRNVKAD